MKVRKGYKFLLRTNKKTDNLLSQFVGCNRYIWNRALSICKEGLDKEEKEYVSYHQLASQLVTWKRQEETTFLKQAPSQSLQQTLKHLDRALKDCFKKKKKFPRFKKRGLHDSFNLPQGFKIEGNRVFLPKLGRLKFVKTREIEGNLKNVTISRKSGKWYISFQVEQEIQTPIHPSTSQVGIDLGISKMVVVSNGEIYKGSTSFKRFSFQMKKLQRGLARKEQFSSNWKKQKAKISKLHTQISNIRKDRNHWITTKLSKKHASIYVEDLKVLNMSVSAKGTLENPGKNVKAKSGLNRSILDQGWYNFVRMLEYKQAWRGGELKRIDPKYTSQRCFVCGYISKKNRTSQSKFSCLECGYEEDADFNASKNILAVGQTVSACGDIKLVTA